MSIWVTILLFVVGLVLIVKGGDWFLDGAVWIAEATGVPHFIIGATVVLSLIHISGGSSGRAIPWAARRCCM